MLDLLRTFRVIPFPVCPSLQVQDLRRSRTDTITAHRIRRCVRRTMRTLSRQRILQAMLIHTLLVLGRCRLHTV